MNKEFVFIIAWSYSDGSGSKVVRCYLSEERAILDYELVRNDDSKIWILDKVELIK